VPHVAIGSLQEVVDEFPHVLGHVIIVFASRGGFILHEMVLPRFVKLE
jgi:hypothetical protein